MDGNRLSNDDFVKEASSVVDYNHKLLGKEIISGKDCFKIEMIPKPSATIVRKKVMSANWKIDFTGQSFFEFEEYRTLGNNFLLRLRWIF